MNLHVSMFPSVFSLLVLSFCTLGCEPEQTAADFPPQELDGGQVQEHLRDPREAVLALSTGPRVVPYGDFY